MTYATAKDQRTLTVKEAADLLDVSERTIRNMIVAGELSAYRLTPAGKSPYRIPRLQVTAILEARRAAGRLG